jgi:hypothetical protein
MKPSALARGLLARGVVCSALAAGLACSKTSASVEVPLPSEAGGVTFAAPGAAGSVPGPGATPPPSDSPGIAASSETTPSPPGSPPSSASPSGSTGVGGSSTRLLEAGQAPRRRLRYRWRLDQKEQLAMDLRTSAATEIAGSKQPEIPLPPVHIVLDIDPRSITPEGDLRYAWRVSAATVISQPQTPSPIADGMRAEVSAVDHLAGTAMVTSRGLCTAVSVEIAPSLDAGATGQMVEQVRQTLRDIAAPFPEEDIGIGARWQKISELDAKGSRLTQTDTFTLVDPVPGDISTVDDVLAQTAPSQLLRTPGMNSGAEARMESMLASGDAKTRFDLSRLVPQTRFTGTTTMIVSGQSGQAGTQRVTMVMRIGLEIQGRLR